MPQFLILHLSDAELFDYSAEFLFHTCADNDVVYLKLAVPLRKN